ncbi:MAG TPA: signal peptidase II [Kofleriaceae bacterium]|nr:signal peptidase II [Kofleriaceae bacterium]
MRHRLVLLVLLGVAMVGCDQATKEVAQSRLQGAPSVEILGGVVTMAYAENPGAFLGLGDRLPDGARAALLIGVNLVVLAALGWWAFRRRQDTLVRVAATLVIAGGVGNLIDRLLREGGRVVDFLVLGVGPVRTGVFNVADVAVMVGVGLLFLRLARPAPESAGDAT